MVSNETYCPHCKAVVTLSDLLTFLPDDEWLFTGRDDGWMMEWFCPRCLYEFPPAAWTENVLTPKPPGTLF